MPKYEIHRVEDSGLGRPFSSVACDYFAVEEGVYIFHDYNKKWTPELVLPVRSFWVAKVEGG